TLEGDSLDVLTTWSRRTKRSVSQLFRLERQGLDNRALAGVIGGRSRVYEVMHRKRALSLEMIRRLHACFGIPAEVLIKPTRLKSRSKGCLEVNRGALRSKTSASWFVSPTRNSSSQWQT